MNTVLHVRRGPIHGVGPVRKNRCWQWLHVLICLALLLCLDARHMAQAQLVKQTISVSGGLVLPDGDLLPNFFTWGATIKIRGSGWGPNETIPIHMVGPLNLPGVTPRDWLLDSVFSDSSGNIAPSFEYDPGVGIPFNYGIVSPPDTPRPGNYQVYAGTINPFTHLGAVFAVDHINLCPKTVPSSILSIPPYNAFPDFILWPRERGARTGVLDSESPELADPEWVSVWDEQPVAFYATVAKTDLKGKSDPQGWNQPAFISHAEWPGTHYAHDLNLELIPDKDFQWVLGDANFVGDAADISTGRLEWEWETQNNGSPFLYGRGNIGIPTWATPTAEDRIYTVGRWVMDDGENYRTEIHPARMLATMRKRNTAVPFFAPGGTIMTRASQVDVYVSGHGGGANQFPDALSQLLINAGSGGGQMSYILGGNLYNTYYAYGPEDSDAVKFLINLYESNGSSLSGVGDLIQPVAGPSGLGWPNGPEARPVNDMDYDFDVPLPVAPPGATSVQVRVVTHPEHTTGVKEVITYTNPDATTGLPTIAHIHLPYLGADSGIYARTLNFYWNQFSPPGDHFFVQFNDINNTYPEDDNPRTWNLWADVCGQWLYLSGLDPSFTQFTTQQGAKITGLDAAHFDVYLDPGDPLRVFVQGYERHSFDFLFGFTSDRSVNRTQIPAYDEAISVAENNFFSDGENHDLGGAVFEGATFPINTMINMKAEHKGSTSSDFNVDFTVTHVNSPPRLGVSGTPVDFGKVCFGSSQDHIIHLSNVGQNPLLISSITVSGGGFSQVAGQSQTFTIPGGGSTDITLRFKPSQIAQGTGTLTIKSNDLLQPSVTYPLTAIVGYPTINAKANTGRTPSLVVGSTTTWAVTITNSGTCFLDVKPSISGAGFSFTLPSNYYNPITGALIKNIVVPPGGTNTDLTVVFKTPSVASKFVGTLTLTSNDPVHPTTTLIFGAEGVPVGMRLLVLQPNGTPYSMVDEIELKRVHPNVSIHLKNVPLTTIDPPNSWKRIQYHFQRALPPTDTTEGDDILEGEDITDPDFGNDRDGHISYHLRIRIGDKTKTLGFTLASGEFKQLTITIP